LSTAQRPERIEYAGQGGDAVNALLAQPSGEGLRAGLVLVHEVFGLEAHIEELALRFAAEGYVVVAPDLWSREGRPGPEPSEGEPAPEWSVEQIQGAVTELSDRRALADLEAALGWLEVREDVDRDRLVVVGFCMGGNYAYQLGCTSRRVAAVVDFYGRLVYDELSASKPIQPLELALNLSSPSLFHFGRQDASIPEEHVARLETVLGQFAKRFEVERWTGAGHGFLNEYRAGYHGPSARAAWDRTLRFLREELELE
jgi:carboxymethylenebutenolidase